MSNEFKVRKGLIVNGPSTLSGSVDITGSLHAFQNVTIDDTLTINGTLLFNKGGEQTLSTGSSVVFGSLTDSELNNAGGIVYTDSSGLLQNSANATLDGTGALGVDTIDTGQGATDVYLMNQNVRTTDDVEFGDIRANGNIIGDKYATLLTNLIVGHNPEGSFVTNPMLVNDLGFATEKNVSFTINNGWSANNLSNCFDGTASYIAVRSADVPSGGLVIEFESPRRLNYGSYFGISFGSSIWAPAYVKLEAYSEGAWVTVKEVSNNSSEVVMNGIAGNSGVGTTKFRVTIDGVNVNGSYSRLTHIFAYNYNSPLTETLHVKRDGGFIYGDLDVRDGIDINGSPFVDASRNVTAGTGDFSDILTVTKTLNAAIHINNSGTSGYAILRFQQQGHNTWGFLADNTNQLRMYNYNIGKYVHYFNADNSVEFGGDTTSIGLLTANAGLDVTGDADVSGNLTITGSSTFNNNITFLTQVSSDDYISGILGNGSILDNDASGGSFFEVDNMRIRGSLRTHIFKKDIIRASNGYFYISDSSEIADTVTTPTTTGSNFIFTVKNNVFSSGDTIEYKDEDEVSGTIYHVSASVTDNGTSRSLNGKTVYDYSASLASGTSVDLRAGDTIVRTSGGTILNDASSQYSPFIDVLNNRITKVRLGNLAGITDNINGQSVSGYGLYSDNAFLKGGIVATYGKVGGWDITTSFISASNLILNDSGQIVNTSQINSNNAYQLNSNGSGWFAGKNFQWDTSGNIDVSDISASNAYIDGTIIAGNGTIGGWNINSTTLTGGSVTLNSAGSVSVGSTTYGNAGVQLDDTSGGRLYAGDGATNFVKFDGTNISWQGTNTSLTTAGVFTATNADIQGNITASNLRIDNNFSLGVSMSLDAGGVITDGGVGSNYTLSQQGLVFAGGASGKLGIGISSMARFGEYSGGSNGYMGAIGGYNDDGTVSTPTEGNLYLQGGRDSSGNSVGTIHYDAVDHKLNGVLNLDTLSDETTNPSRLVIPVGTNKYAT